HGCRSRPDRRGRAAARVLQFSPGAFRGCHAMSRSNTGSEPDPWRVPVIVAQIPDTGLHREIEASAAERKVMAEVASVREILSANASFDVVPKSGGRLHVTGHVRAR